MICNIWYYLLGRDGIHSCLQYYTQSPCCSSLSQAGGNIYRQCISGNLNNKQLAFYNLKCEQSQPSFCLISLYRSSSFADPDQTGSSQNELVNNLNSKSNPVLNRLKWEQGFSSFSQQFFFFMDVLLFKKSRIWLKKVRIRNTKFDLKFSFFYIKSFAIPLSDFLWLLIIV